MKKLFSFLNDGLKRLFEANEVFLDNLGVEFYGNLEK